MLIDILAIKLFFYIFLLIGIDGFIILLWGFSETIFGFGRFDGTPEEGLSKVGFYLILLILSVDFSKPVCLLLPFESGLMIL